MKNQLRTCFCEAAVNTGRQPEADIAKGMSAIFMVLCHVYGWLIRHSDFCDLVVDCILGGPFAAPVFMFCMGMGMGYTGKNQPRDYLRRGIDLLWIGLLFGISRDVLPVLLVWFLGGDPAVLENLYLFFCTDILRFAGLSFLLFALLQKMRVKPWGILVIAVVLSCAGMLLQNVSTGVFLLDVLTGYLWKSWDYALFPLLNWFIFPACGYVFSLLWKHCRDKGTVFRTLTPVCGVISAVYIGAMLHWGLFFLSRWEYYGIGPLDAVFFLVIIFFCLGIGYYLQRLPGWLTAFLSRLAKNINGVYWIHWLLIYGIFLPSVYLFGPVYYPGWLLLPISLGITVVSDRLAQRFPVEKLSTAFFSKSSQRGN